MVKGCYASTSDKNIIFVYILAMGTGKSKKEAKHAAAKALIDKLAGNAFGETTTGGLTVKAEYVQPMIFIALTAVTFASSELEPMVRMNHRAIPLGGFRKCAWPVAGHHQPTRRRWKLACHTSGSLPLPARS